MSDHQGRTPPVASSQQGRTVTAERLRALKEQGLCGEVIPGEEQEMVCIRESPCPLHGERAASDAPERVAAVVAFGLNGNSFVWLDVDSRIRSDIEAYGEFDVEPPCPWPKTAGVYRMTCTVHLYPTWDEYSGKTWVEPEYTNPTYTPLWTPPETTDE